MVQLDLDIPAKVAPQAIEAAAEKYGYDASSGGTPQEFMQVFLANWFLDILKEKQAKEAAETARTDFDSELKKP